MNKGFDYWSSEKESFFIRVFWPIYFIFYLVAIWLSISTRNPFAFLFIGLLPYLMLRIYKAMHDPLYDLKDSVERITPGLFQSIVEQKSKLNIKIDAIKPKQQTGLLYGGLLLLNKDDVDRKILVYINNNKRFNRTSMLSLTLWFFTFLVCLFVLFIKR